MINFLNRLSYLTPSHIDVSGENKKVKAKYNDKFEINGIKMKTSLTVNSDQKQKLRTTWDLMDFYFNTKLDHISELNKETLDNETEIRVIHKNQTRTTAHGFGFTVDGNKNM